MTARLFILSGKALGTDFTFASATTLGRGEGAGVRLNDPSVSRLHARMEPEGDGWRVTDLDSSNGIFVGGKRVKTALLKDLEEFRVGALELRIRIDGKSPEVSPSVSAPAPSATTKKSPAAAPVETPAPEAILPQENPAPQSDLSEESSLEIELEGDWSEPAAPTISFTPPAQESGERSFSPPASHNAPAAQTQDPARPVLQSAVSGRSAGLLSGDLGQQPLLVRWGLYLLAVAFFIGLAWGVSRLVFGVRKARATPPIEAF